MSEKMSAAEIARLLEAVNEAMRDGGAPNALFVSLAFYRDLLISHATLQREADGLREALTKLREACEPFQTEVSSWAPDFPPNGVALGDHDPALSVTWGDLLLLDIAAMDARAELNGPPQAPALEDNNGI